MKGFEVRLRRTVTQDIQTTVSVTAETEELAIAKAIKHATGSPQEWSGDIAAPSTFGKIEILGVEEIVDLDASD